MALPREVKKVNNELPVALRDSKTSHRSSLMTFQSLLIKTVSTTLYLLTEGEFFMGKSKLRRLPY